jgi:adenylate cyclase
MRSLGPRVRITAQLIDVGTGTQLWAEKFDRERAELFDIQDEVVRAVAASTQIQLMIREGENRARDASEDCWALTMQANSESYKMTAESLARTEQIARRLTREYPRWARGHALLSAAIYHLIIMGFEPASAGRKDEALREARQGAALDPRDEFNLINLAMPLMDFAGDTGEALVLMRRTLEINPNFSLGYALVGDAQIALGQPDEAIRHAEAALRLNPRDPANFYRYETLAKASLQKGDDDMALHWASQIAALKPDYWPGYAIAAAAMVGKGDIDKARRSAEALKTCWRGVSVSAIRGIEAHRTEPWRQRYFNNLIVAGVPE